MSSSGLVGVSTAASITFTQAPPGIRVMADGISHHDIARDIGHQVEVQVLGAKRLSEAKVGKEIAKLKAKIESMGEKIKTITERLVRLERASGGGGVLWSDVQKAISKFEVVWEEEVSSLKNELWQTIQAHNHNADLLKHHMDAIDGIQNQLTEDTPDPETEQMHAQLLQVDKIVQREVAKEAQMHQLMQRLAVVQQQIVAHVACATGGHWLGVSAGIAGYTASGPASGGTAIGKRGAQKKVGEGGVAGKASKGANSAPPQGANAASLGGLTLRAEAPEFVPGC
jgi:hypothetical protein|eukprot:TRINITY_DN43548_c0_g1_i1.p1 TRINITY_DN43548_c0_g1~~TRINITY_DN43548_c0_g1_i1.p1  ORF type:complete len:284 (+),score=63.94 TRINITY_DN43548_c0_g1_i1:65-916(+)